jgi:hypothetical protein
VRMERVKELVAQTDLSLTAIAHRTGYAHVEYLSVVFKRETGLPPSAYRDHVRARGGGRVRRRGGARWGEQGGAPGRGAGPRGGAGGGYRAGGARSGVSAPESDCPVPSLGDVGARSTCPGNPKTGEPSAGTGRRPYLSSPLHLTTPQRRPPAGDQ